MNRIRCTKFLLLVVLVSLFAYLMLKDESVCITVNSVHNAMTAREIATLLQGGQYLHHSKFENNNLCQGFSFLFSFSFFFLTRYPVNIGKLSIMNEKLDEESRVCSGCRECHSFIVGRTNFIYGVLEGVVALTAYKFCGFYAQRF